MGKNVEHIQHIKSNVVLENGKPKLPQPGTLVEGELAVNYAKDVETISLENASGEVVTFSSDKYYTEQKLGSAFTGANSAVTVTDVIEENEEIISSALNDLETRKLDTSAYTPTEELWVSGTGLNSVVLKGSSGTASGDYAVAEGYTYEYDGETYTSIASGIYSHTEGAGTLASGDWGSHAEGDSTSATSDSSHAEGYGTLAEGYASHAEGDSTSATNNSSHAEGIQTKAFGDFGSHAEGWSTIASGESSHAEGHSTSATSTNAHTEGYGTQANGYQSHAEGDETIANGNDSHTEGYMTIANNIDEHASGRYNVSNSASTEFGDSGNTLFSVGNGDYETRHNAFEIRQNGDIYINSGGTDILLQEHLGGGGSITIDDEISSATSGSNNAVSTSAVYDYITEDEKVISAALNDLNDRKLDASDYTELWISGTGLNSVVLANSNNVADGESSVAEGYATSAMSYDAHAEGSETIASGDYSHAEGDTTSATNYSSHAEGFKTLAEGDSSHAEGWNTQAIGDASHAEGYYSVASDEASHAEGHSTSATSTDSHAEGDETLASGFAAHAEGEGSSATSEASHAEGMNTIANGDYSHAEGISTIANNNAEHASGRYNASNTGESTSAQTLFSVGNGYYDESQEVEVRHNAFEIRQNGDIYIASGNSDIKLQDYLGGGGGSITVDQVLDNTTSASTNPVSSKAVYDAVTDNELVWTNAYVTLSGTVSAHTANTEIHVTSADKEKLHTHSNKSALDSITGNVGTMAYQNTNSYSSATQVSTALQGKSNSNHNQGANTITAMTNYNAATAGTSSISTSDNLNTAIGKLENRFDGICLLKISQTDYDNLQTKDPNTLYVITD